MAMAMNNEQLTGIREPISPQLAALSATAAAEQAARQATDAAFEALRQATDIMSQAMDARIVACQDDIEAVKLELKDAQEKQAEAKERQFGLLDRKALNPKVFNGSRKQWQAWSRTIKAYLNYQYQGALDALECVRREATRQAH